MSKKRINRLIFIWVLALILSMIAAYLTFIDRGYTEVCFVDVGQGDACFIRTDNGSSVLIDGGANDSGRYTLTSFFNKNFVRKLDAVFISHLHTDHTQGIIELIDDGFPIERLYVSDIALLDKDYSAIKSRADRSNIPIEAVYGGETIEIDDVTFTVVASGREEGPAKNENDNSVILRMDCGENSFLFTGDASSRLEKQLLDNTDIDVDFLKVGHHGSFSSSSSDFIKEVSPKLAVVSVGSDNDYGHPSPEAMQRFDALDVPVMRTDYDGTVTIIMTAEDIRNIKSSRQRR